MKETLSKFVKRIREEKNLSTSDVQKASDNRISDAYVSQIENGNVRNVSLEKLTALANGLDIPEVDIIQVALGLPDDLETRFQGYAARFGVYDLSTSEWEYLEAVFKDHVEMFRDARAKRQKQIEDMMPG